MRLILQSFVNRLSQHPLRGVLSIFSMALGVAAVVLVLNLSFRLQDSLNNPVQAYESILVVANATVGEDGSTSWEGPGAFSAATVSALKREYPALTSVVSGSTGSMPFEIRVGEEYYRIRRVVPTVPAYRDLYDLEMVAGSFLTAADLEEAAPVVVVGEEIATVLFGGPEAAVGRTVTRVQMGAPTAGRERAFTVIGVFEDPPYYQRMVQGVGDAVVPQALFERFGADNYRVIMGRLNGVAFDEAKPRVEAIMESLVGEEVPVAVWQGSPSNPRSSGILEAMARTVRTATTFFGALGMVALLISAFGIFSSMLVSILERTREIGLRRALGSTRPRIVAHFMGESMIFTLIGVALGVAIAVLFNGSIITALTPMFTFGPPGTEPELPLTLGIQAIGAGAALALLLGTVFGMLPAAGAARVSPMESLRDQ